MIFRSTPLDILSFAKGFLFRATLFVFSFFLIFGNSLRLFSLQGFHDQILLSEFILYVFCFLSFLDRKILLRSKFLAFSLVVFFSAILGIISFGFHVKPLLYAFRLVAMVMTGVVLGELLFKKIGMNLPRFCKYWIRIYSYCCLLGFFLFLVFPSSAKLWVFLTYFGIHIRGDPHQMRFISPYFDPNFFCAIAIIPFLLSWIVKKVDSWYKWSYLLFALSIVLTWSRSGIAAFLCVLFFLVWNNLIASSPLKRKSLLVFGVGSLLFLIILGLTSDQLYYFTKRFLEMGRDQSALCRLISFQLGIKFFSAHPWGIGYNYLAVFLDNYTQLSSVDSSLLATLICFGAPLFLLFCVLYIVFCTREYYRFRRIKKIDPMLYQCFSYLFFYLQVVVFFSSWFNNILYLQFWLIPMIAIFNYLSLYRGNCKTSGYAKSPF